MTQKLQSNISHRRGVSYVKLAGVVDEDNQLGDWSIRSAPARS
jgi:hypothetical protein